MADPRNSVNEYNEFSTINEYLNKKYISRKCDVFLLILLEILQILQLITTATTLYYFEKILNMIMLTQVIFQHLQIK